MATTKPKDTTATRVCILLFTLLILVRPAFTMSLTVGPEVGFESQAITGPGGGATLVGPEIGLRAEFSTRSWRRICFLLGAGFEEYFLSNSSVRGDGLRGNSFMGSAGVGYWRLAFRLGYQVSNTGTPSGLSSGLSGGGLWYSVGYLQPIKKELVLEFGLRLVNSLFSPSSNSEIPGNVTSQVITAVLGLRYQFNLGEKGK